MGDRVFFDWSVPCLPAAASWLLRERAGVSGVSGASGGAGEVEIDLSQVVCVVPGSRSGRLLHYFLVKEAASSGRPLLPPQVVTPGHLQRVLLTTRAAVATPVECRLAWRGAVERASDQTLRALDIEDDSPRARAALAKIAYSLADVVSAGEYDFETVAKVIAETGNENESNRWLALAKIEASYIQLLKEAGLADPSRESIRGAKNGEVEHDLHIVLIGVTELNARQRRIIGACQPHVAALVHAPEEVSDAFDDLGCIAPESWVDRPIELDDSSIHIVNRSFDQAQEVFQLLASESGEGRTCDEVTIGLGDESLQPTLVRAAKWAGVHVHAAAGSPIAGTSPMLFLELAAKWVEEPRFVHLTALIRHPEVERRVRFLFENDEEAQKAVARWLGFLEEYFAEHLQDRFDGSWLGTPEDQDRMKTIWQSVESLFARFNRTAMRPLREWCDAVIALLADVFGYLPTTGGSDSLRTIEACRKISSTTTSLAQAAGTIQPNMNAADAIRMIMDETRGESIPAEAREKQIDMLGWLELHLDPAPNLILTGFNDGAIPRSVQGDAFLPDSLRAQLGLACNETRAARDAYLLSAILSSRERVEIIVGKRGGNEEPLSPSRFLFYTDDETVLKRVRKLVATHDENRGAAAFGLAGPAERSAFTVPALPDDLDPPTGMSVTEFKDFLACPYRWALARLLKIKTLEPIADELSPMIYGNVTHEVLEAFGKEPGVVDSIDPKEIFRFLESALQRIARERFGRSLLPAVHVQLASIAQRLRDFAWEQARWRADGWCIREIEMSFTNDDNIQLDIPGQDGMTLRGRIDRLDQNEQTGAWRIIDYKTTESEKSPIEAHHGGKKIPDDIEGRWIDLQLPLYHYMLSQAKKIDQRTTEVGYVVLPKQSGATRFTAAEWDKELLAEAIDVARDVVRRIRNREFEINPEFTGWENYERLCQTTVFGGANYRANNEGTADERR